MLSDAYHEYRLSSFLFLEHNDIRYAYECCDNGLLNGKWSGRTAERVLMGFQRSRFSIWELGKGDGMKMDCGSDGALSSFVLKTRWELHVVYGHYEFTCVKVDKNHYNHSQHKSFAADVKRHLAYLDRLHVDCGNGIIKSHNFDLPYGDGGSHWNNMAEEAWCKCPTGGC